MSDKQPLDRRSFMKDALLASAGGALALRAAGHARADSAPGSAQPAAMPTGRIGPLTVSRLLLGGNLLTHVTHSRDLRYVRRLAAQYNTEAKILDTLALAEQHGINTLVMTAVPVFETVRKYRKAGGKIQWIVAPTVKVEPGLQAYRREVERLAEAGTDAIYLLGHWGDGLAGAGKMDLLAQAVDAARHLKIPSGVGCHDLKVVAECEKHKVPADFYIKTFHHHRYPTAPKADELRGAFREVPGYWCRDPKATAELMHNVAKPWIAFKVMAAGAIPPAGAFAYAFDNGADHVLAGMFDFEIAEDAAAARAAVAKAKRQRPWRS